MLSNPMFLYTAGGPTPANGATNIHRGASYRSAERSFFTKITRPHFYFQLMSEPFPALGSLLQNLSLESKAALATERLKSEAK